jgi:hypothetical protein
MGPRSRIRCKSKKRTCLPCSRQIHLGSYGDQAQNLQRLFPRWSRRALSRCRRLSILRFLFWRLSCSCSAVWSNTRDNLWKDCCVGEKAHGVLQVLRKLTQSMPYSIDDSRRSRTCHETIDECTSRFTTHKDSDFQRLSLPIPFTKPPALQSRHLLMLPKREWKNLNSLHLRIMFDRQRDR